GIFVEDMGKQLIGKKSGETVRISMTGPGGHEDEKIRDQPITLVMELQSVQRVQPLAIEELLSSHGVENEQELREQIQTMLEQRAEQQATAAAHKQLADALVERVEMDLPPGLTGKQIERVLSRKRYELMMEGKTADEVDAALAEARTGTEEEAIRELKQFFVLDKAAKELDVEVGEAEINGQISMMAMQQGRRPEKLRQEMAHRGELEQMFMQIREHKTLDELMNKVKVDMIEVEPQTKTSKKKTSRKKTTSKKKTVTKKKAASKKKDAKE
ncbi:MAG: hypothetical protein MI741_23925, partial [Rhodospirillales bacterium]|nr:hypothetical protein [Rhodospirillales bacterium]